MNNELVFSVGQIFDATTDDGGLGRHQADRFLIAPYQRGYKWGFEPENGAVSMLLKDLLEQYHQGKKEYYLQYITTQVNEFGEYKVLEVIDGQQRLTTLTLLFAVMASLTGNDELAFVRYKLLYQVRDKVTAFFEACLYNNIEILFEADWDEFVDVHPENNEQDIYYLFHAVQRIFGVVKEFGHDLAVLEFARYVRDQVKIILNNVDGNISCEKIFSNLNNNKVELTNVELIKGLFLTKAAREKIADRQPGYKEVVEVRALLGRQWDEIVAWAFLPDIRAIFFNRSGNPVYELLLLLARKHTYKPDPASADKYTLFNFFQTAVKSGQHTASHFFNELKKMQAILQNWFSDRSVYNTLGFVLFAKKADVTMASLVSILEKPLREVEVRLKRRAFKYIPDDIDKLDFKDNDKEIHRVLLALSIFSGTERFNFTKFSAGSWSLEHIFPQKPDDLPDTLQKEDLDLIMSLLIVPITDKTKLLQKFGKFSLTTYNSIRKKIARYPCKLNSEEKALLYKFIRTDQLNRMGNMALLTSSDNSSNSNGMFSDKRHNIVDRISTGSFVPKHTYDVFSKLISDKMTKDMAVWSDKDITVHQQWIKSRIDHLRKDLQQS